MWWSSSLDECEWCFLFANGISIINKITHDKHDTEQVKTNSAYNLMVDVDEVVGVDTDQTYMSWLGIQIRLIKNDIELLYLHVVQVA